MIKLKIKLSCSTILYLKRDYKPKLKPLLLNSKSKCQPKLGHCLPRKRRNRRFATADLNNIKQQII